MDVTKALEHKVLRKRARNQAMLATKTAEVDQVRHELAEERSRMASLLQELEELRLSASVEQNHRYQADDRARKAKEE